jgi:hypothetical protein
LTSSIIIKQFQPLDNSKPSQERVG